MKKKVTIWFEPKLAHKLCSGQLRDGLSKENRKVKKSVRGLFHVDFSRGLEVNGCFKLLSD
jgi:hypothetical protein